MRFFVAEGAPQNDGGFLVASGLGGAGGGRGELRRFALNVWRRGGLGKAAAEPPHSKSSWRSVWVVAFYSTVKGRVRIWE